MSKILPLICIDNKIQLSDKHRSLLESNFLIREIDISSPDVILLNKCEFLMIHSFFSSQLLSNLVKCKYIGIRAHNLDYVDIEIATKMGIYVEGIPAVAQQSVAEHTFSLILALAKHLIISNTNVISARWRQDLPMNIELFGKSLGIVGYGEIGKMVGKIGQSFGMKIIIAEKQKGSEGVPIDEVLATADVLTLHIPARESNRLFMNEEKIRKMKKGSILINTSRGAILDYEAAERAIRDGHLAGLGLDVFAKEPLKNYNFSEKSNVICTPHVAFNTDMTIQRMNDYLINNLMMHIQTYS